MREKCLIVKKSTDSKMIKMINNQNFESTKDFIKRLLGDNSLLILLIYFHLHYHCIR